MPRSGLGFTLIEVMVALVVVTLGMTAVYMQLSQYASNAIYLRDKTLASWIGSNTVTELSIQPDWPETGGEEIEVPFADRLWTVTIEITETEVANLRRADVSVALADRPERIIHTVSALIEPPVPQGFPPVSWFSVSQGPAG
ncbi:MAG TPA: type II secretion system minor pseudopilin GspI [Gammaproteobacteria bacterium]|nr:type II secretion system minor pseudopilin GspI [Gammaproteobacteria bacterium]